MFESHKIYHITHIDNLPKILKNGYLFSDTLIKSSDISLTDVGMPHIKQRRNQKPVPCYPDTTIGEYVPFYFCPRSVMLFILHKGNHPDIAYQGGQENIITLEFNVSQVVEWANKNSIKWVFTDRNASTGYAQFYNSLLNLESLNWQAIQNPDFRLPEIRESKQAEFLIYNKLPTTLISQIGVYDHKICSQTKTILTQLSYTQINVSVLRDWYY